MKVLVCLILLLFSFSFSGKARTLESIVSELGTLTPEELSKEIESLPEEEKIKLQILLLSYTGKDKQVRDLIERFYPKKLLSNVLLLPQGEKAIVVDKTNEILYVVSFRKGIPYIEKRYPCITGKRPGDKLEEGDMRTPEGIYFPLYWRSGLPKMYGLGAYPLNYPNLVDKKILKRNGHGIWIHGTDNPNRSPHSTNGCVALRNDYLEELRRIIKPKITPVIIVSSLNFSNKKDYVKEQKSIYSFLLRWKSAWENTPQDLDSYLSLYSKHFVWNRGSYKEWVNYKKRVTKQKRWIRIKLKNISISKDGRLLSFGNLYVAAFDLEYNSNNFSSKGKKLLYIVREGKQWKILGEENL
jgi:murein L,D-transpeptidase YafK